MPTKKKQLSVDDSVSRGSNGAKSQVKNGANGPPVMADLEPKSAMYIPSLLGQRAFRLLQSTVSKYLSKVPGVDAVFITTEDGVIHVYTVVLEYNSNLTGKLMAKERLIERDWPGIRFEFHTRAHQGREPSLAVPFDAQTVFRRP